ncbi:MAG: crosslink repair DNA glycosylase YcaQ family protein, partial [Vicinamibacterales bacterium]
MTLRLLRRHAINQSLFTPTTLPGAIERLGFVQADPIRSPARAQDLILRHRVSGYRAGDLERQYAELDIEEDYLYAYGFLSKPVWQLLHPRKTPPLRAFEKKVLETVTGLGEAHPRVLEAHLGKRRVTNAWGGYSKATTHALEWLHWRGLLRIARRENGIRVYRPAAPRAVPAAPDRLRALVMVYARIFAPSPEKSLQSVIARHRELGGTRQMLTEMI